MHQPIQSDCNLLTQAGEAFAQWRATRAGRGRIPEKLWDMACRAAHVHGLSKTAQTLKLDYYRLQRRLGGETAPTRRSAEATKDRRQSNATAAFIELPPMSPGGDHSECELEFENGQGTRLSLRWKGSSAPDLALLGQLIHQR